jgi:three-Cys-motif partner protein
MSKQTDSHFVKFGPLQKTKHTLLMKYLGAWYPILASANSRLVVFDTHAGRGRFSTGEPGSPLVVLRTLLDHKFCRRMLASTEFVFYFLEQDDKEFCHLQANLGRVRTHPNFDEKKIVINAARADSFKVLEEIADHFEHDSRRIAPAFFFVDPFGFTLNGDVLKRLLTFERTEVLLTFMWHFTQLGLASANRAPGMDAPLNGLFAGAAWKGILGNGQTDEQRADLAVDLLRNSYGVKWASSLKMRDLTGGIKYCMVHLTNNDLGREKIKDAIWAIGPDEHFVWRNYADSGQGILFEKEFDYEPVKDWLTELLGPGKKLMWQLDQDILASYWKPTHVHKALKLLFDEQHVLIDPPAERCVIKNLRSIHLARQQKGC